MQPEPYQDFAAETAVLRAILGELGIQGAAYVLGDALAGLQWHIFVADCNEPLALPRTYTLEVCMTDLCPLKVLHSLKLTCCFPSSAHGYPV